MSFFGEFLLLVLFVSFVYEFCWGVWLVSLVWGGLFVSFVCEFCLGVLFGGFVWELCL